MTNFLERWEQASDANARLVAEETLIVEATEEIWNVLQRTGTSKLELAERLGVSKGYVSQVLSGSRNMTLRTLASICHVLGAQPLLTVKLDDTWEASESVDYRIPSSQKQLKHLRLATFDGAPVASEPRLAA